MSARVITNLYATWLQDTVNCVCKKLEMLKPTIATGLYPLGYKYKFGMVL